MHFDTSIKREFLPAGAPAALKRLVLKIALRVPCLFACLSVCASALITCAIYYVIHYYATAVYSSFWGFAGQATANEGSCMLPRWRKLGRQPKKSCFRCIKLLTGGARRNC